MVVVNDDRSIDDNQLTGSLPEQWSVLTGLYNMWVMIFKQNAYRVAVFFSLGLKLNHYH
jgi:hypothetical protein